MAWVGLRRLCIASGISTGCSWLLSLMTGLVTKCSPRQGRFFLSNESVIHRSLRSGATLAARGVSQRLPSLADGNETARSVWLADHDRPSQAIFAGQHLDRAEERRVGTKGVSTSRSRWWP